MKIAALFAPLTFAVALGAPAHADTQPAMAGHGWPGEHERLCFVSSFARMLNNCVDSNQAAHILLVIPIQAASGTTKHTFARYASNGFLASSTDCQAKAIDGANNAFMFGNKPPTSSPFVQTFDLGFVTIPSGGTLQFECNVAEGGGQVVNVEAD